MSKESSQAKRVDALALYLKGIAKDTIARMLNLGHVTIDKWEKIDNWKTKLNNLNNEVSEKVYESIRDERIRSLTIIKAVESQFAQALQSGQVDMSNLSSYAAIQRVKWEILNPKKETSYNLINHSGPAYSLEIIHTHDIKNEVEAKPQTG